MNSTNPKHGPINATHETITAAQGPIESELYSPKSLDIIIPDNIDTCASVIDLAPQQCVDTLRPDLSHQLESNETHDASPSSIYDIADIENKYQELNDLHVVGDTMVYTINGLYKICDLVNTNKEIEIWSGKRWFRVLINQLTSNMHDGPRVKSPIHKITLCNGACLKCTNMQTWAVIDNKKITPVTTDDLEIDMRIPMFTLPDKLTGDIVKNAYDVGRQTGKLFISKQYLSSNRHIGLPAQIYKLCPQSLGRFIAGWMDSQNGNIYGNYSVIHDLQLLLARLHIYISYIVKKNTYYMLEIPDKSNIPNPNNQIRRSDTKIKSNKLYINSIETIESTQKIFMIQNLDYNTKTIVLDGVLAII